MKKFAFVFVAATCLASFSVTGCGRSSETQVVESEAPVEMTATEQSQYEKDMEASYGKGN